MKNLFNILLSLTLVLPLTVLATDNNAAAVYNEQKTNIVATSSHPEFTIKLKSNPTTGYSWFLRKYNSQYLQPLKHSFQAPENNKMIGASGYEIWTFKLKPEAFLVPLQTSLHFVYARPWEKSKQTTELVFWVSTTGK